MREKTHETPDIGVGELARRTGLTVRTLHHYEAIGLLLPAARTEAGHRRYTTGNLTRLEQIVSLRALGLPLPSIKRMLDENVDPLGPIEQLRASLVRQRAQAQQLIERLDEITARYHASETVSADEIIKTIRFITMFEKYYTSDQIDRLKARREEVGQDRIEQVQSEWKQLFDAMDAFRRDGIDPNAPEVQALARRAESLIGEFTGGDAGIRTSLNTAYSEQKPAMYEAWGIDEALGEYYGRAMSIFHRPKS